MFNLYSFNLFCSFKSSLLQADVESKTQESQIEGEEEGSSRKFFYENLAKNLQNQKFSFEVEKDINVQIDALEKEALEQTDIKKKYEITKRLLTIKSELEIKKIKIANKSVKKKILDIVKETAIKQGVYNTEGVKQ